MNIPALPPGTEESSALSSRPLWRSADFQRLWLSLQNTDWRTLALVPGGSGQAPDVTVQIAMHLARTGMSHTGRQIHVADATSLSMVSAAQFAQQVRETTAFGPVLMALAPAASSPVTTALAQEADCAVLCVKLGEMKTAEAKRTVQEIGPAHFIGALTIR